MNNTCDKLIMSWSYKATNELISCNVCSCNGFQIRQRITNLIRITIAVATYGFLLSVFTEPTSNEGPHYFCFGALLLTIS